MSLSTTIKTHISSTLSNALDLVTAQSPLSQIKSIVLASGTGAGAADVIFSDQRTLAASTPESLDLAGGGLLDHFGAAFAPAKIKAIYVYAASNNTNDVVLGGDAASVLFLSVATTTVNIEPGGVFLWVAPKTGATVSAGTADIIKVLNGGAGTSVTYDIIIIGTSA